VRPYVHNDNYWQVYFDTNKVISEAGFAIPEQHFQVRQT
jgi:small conductance mechanosensitive channel